jgi:hypothetical protein
MLVIQGNDRNLWREMLEKWKQFSNGISGLYVSNDKQLVQPTIPNQVCNAEEAMMGCLHHAIHERRSALHNETCMPSTTTMLDHKVLKLCNRLYKKLVLKCLPTLDLAQCNFHLFQRLKGLASNDEIYTPTKKELWKASNRHLTSVRNMHVSVWGEYFDGGNVLLGSSYDKYSKCFVVFTYSFLLCVCEKNGSTGSLIPIIWL